MGAGECATVLRMCSDFRSQMTAACGSADVPMVNIALAYEDACAGRRALQTFQDLFAASGEPFELNMHNAWQFDFLRIGRLREAAIAETLRADLVIISMAGGDELPAPVKKWIETSLKQRDGDPGALVLLHEADARGKFNVPPAEIYLAECARRSGMDFFVKRLGTKRGLEMPRTEVNTFAGVRGLKPAMNPLRHSWKLAALGRE